MRFGRGHGNADLSAGFLVGFLECHVWNHARDKAFKVADVYLRIGSEEHARKQRLGMWDKLVDESE